MINENKGVNIINITFIKKKILHLAGEITIWEANKIIEIL